MKYFLIINAFLILSYSLSIAKSAPELTLDSLVGAYSDNYGKRLNVLKGAKREWRAKLVTVNKTTKGDYFCGTEGQVSLKGNILRINTDECSVDMQVTPEKKVIQSGFDKNGKKTNCNCGSAGSWFGDFLRSQKKSEIIDFELPG